MIINRRNLLATAAASMLAVPTASIARVNWRPTRNVTCIIPFTPGGGTDAVFRSVKEHAASRGITMVADYKPGAEGFMGMRAGAAAPADGHSLTFGTIGTMSHVHNGWDAAENHRLITGLRSSMFFLVTGNDSGITSFRELLDRLRSRDVLTTGGSGAPGQRASMETVLLIAGIQGGVIANYRGAAGVMQDLIGNHIQWGMIPGSIAASAVNSGRLRLLATDRRADDQNLQPGSSSIFDILPEYPRHDAQLVAAPRTIPDDILEFWNGFFRGYVSDPLVRLDLNRDFSLAVPFGPDYLHQRISAWRQNVPTTREG